MRTPIVLKQLLLSLIGLYAFSIQAQESLLIEEATVRAPMPGVPNTAAFMTIHNKSQHAVSLLKAEASFAYKVELHTHKYENGLMKMREVSEITVPAQSAQQLQPGGYHIMLFGVTKPLQHGDKVKLKLSFSNDTQLELIANVQDMMVHHHHHHK